MTQKELKQGKVLKFENNEGRIMELMFHNERRVFNQNQFHVWLNGKLYTYKTFQGLKKKANTLIDKFGLKQSNNL